MTDLSVNLFISYSHRDEGLRLQLDKHLASLKRQGVINAWHDRQLEAGMDWAREIDDNLIKADLVLLLVSPDFIFSNYCFEIEMERAIQQHETGRSIVIPIILEPCDWGGLPFSTYQAFPKDAKPITTWTNTNEAFLDVIRGIRGVAGRLFEQRKQKALDKQLARERYRKKVEEILSVEGEISIPGEDTLEELREQLELNVEEARELQNMALEPFKKYQENLQKYEKTFEKVLQREYPIGERTLEALKLRQRDLGIKREDAERIENQMISRRIFKTVEVSGEESPKISSQENNPPDTILDREKNIAIDRGGIPRPVETAIESLDRSIDRFPKEEKKGSSSPPENVNAIEPKFLACCQRVMTRAIGPVARFLLEDTLARHPGIDLDRLVDLLSQEIQDYPNTQNFTVQLLEAIEQETSS